MARKPRPRAAEVPLTNPFSLAAAAKVAAFFAVVTLIVKIVQAEFPGRGVYIVAALAGLTDVDAITLSMAEFAKNGDTTVAVNAIVIAALANTLVKCGMVLILAGPPLRRPDRADDSRDPGGRCWRRWRWAAKTLPQHMNCAHRSSSSGCSLRPRLALCVLCSSR